MPHNNDYCEPDEASQAATPEPPPIPNSNPPLWELVIADMKERDQFGRRKYNTPLQIHNGRDFLVDFYQELLDALVYVKGKLEEERIKRESLNPPAPQPPSPTP